MEVRILGPLEIRVDGRAVVLGAGRQRALLALLALHPNQVVSSDRLIEELWDGVPPATAPKVLQNVVSQLRSLVGSDVIVTQSSGYRLDAGSDAVDAQHFERLAGEGRRALDEDAARAAELLHEALALWRGAPLADFTYERFAQAEIARLEELRLGALEDRVDADLASTRGAELVSELESLVAAHPLRERLRGALMLALYRSGRQADALDAYRQGRAQLQNELGLEPGPALRELEQAILVQDPSLGSPSRPSTPLTRGRRRRWLIAAVIVTVVSGVAAGLVLTRGAAAPSVEPHTLVKIDAATNEIVDVIPVGREPGDVAVVGRYVFVSSELDATLTRVEIDSGDLTTTGAGGADAGLAGVGDRFVWVASRSQARVTRINADYLRPIDFVRIPGDLNFAFVAVGGGSLWVSHYPSSAVLRYRLRSLQLERRYGFDFFETPVEVTYGFGSAWIGLGGSQSLFRIDAVTGKANEIDVGAPSDPTVGFDSIWVATITEGDVRRIDPASERTQAIVAVGQLPFGVTTGAGSVWVTSHCDGTVSRIDPDTNRVVATIETGYHPKWIASGGGFVWVGIGAEGSGGPVTCN